MKQVQGAESTWFKMKKHSPVAVPEWLHYYFNH